MNSRAKGKRGELEAKDWLLSNGVLAKRGGQQGAGGSAENPDVIHDIPGLHFEVKRTEALNFYAAFRQASGDAKSLRPVVMHKRNHAEWMAYLRMHDLLNPPPELVQWWCERVLWKA